MGASWVTRGQRGVPEHGLGRRSPMLAGGPNAHQRPLDLRSVRSVPRAGGGRIPYALSGGPRAPHDRPRRSIRERAHRVLPAPGGAELEDGLGRVVRLLLGARVRRLPRHRVQRDPRGGRRDRHQPALQVRDHGPRRAATARPGDDPRHDEAAGRPRLLLPLVRRGGQGPRRRHDRPPRRHHVPHHGRRPLLPLVRAERHRARRRGRRHQRPHRRARPAGAAQPRGAAGRHGPGLDRPEVLRTARHRDRRRRRRRDPHRLHGRPWLRALDGRRPGPARLGPHLRRRASATASTRSASTRWTSPASRPA